MLNRATEQKTDTVEKLRGGEGVITRQHLIPAEESCGKFKMCAILTLEPGCSIGEHAHQPDAEYCYMMEGEMTIMDGGKEYTVHPGDAWFCGGGAAHYTKNNSDKKAVFMAIVVE
ncbi:MAG: cupin domain-containing protein [Eubacteriales bacterium]|nr:cupin domain-containing protein [Eubacteriales bacterium]